MSKPIAVLISDVHYSLSTLELADKAFRMAIDKAADLKVRLYDLGDLTNDKANLRVEVINALLDTMRYAKSKGVEVTLLVGNHSLVNEKGVEHALNFLSPWATIIDAEDEYFGQYFIPYTSNSSNSERLFSGLNPKMTVFAHQGLKGALPGHYSFDHSAVSKQSVPDGLVVFSGHYHNGQTVKLSEDSSWTYVGNPYTLTFGEANDTTKGFLVLNNDNTFERIPCNLRKHVVAERSLATSNDAIPDINAGDLLWLKITDNAANLALINKEELGLHHLGHHNYRLERIPSAAEIIIDVPKEELSDNDILSQLVDSTTESDESKFEIKALINRLFK